MSVNVNQSTGDAFEQFSRLDDFRQRVRQARYQQRANEIVTGDQNITHYVGQTLLVKGIAITTQDGQYGEQERTMYFLASPVSRNGQTFDRLFSMTQAAAKAARDVLAILGAPPWPEAVPMVIRAVDTKYGKPTEWAEIVGDEDGDDGNPF